MASLLDDLLMAYQSQGGIGSPTPTPGEFAAQQELEAEGSVMARPRGRQATSSPLLDTILNALSSLVDVTGLGDPLSQVGGPAGGASQAMLGPIARAATEASSGLSRKAIAANVAFNRAQKKILSRAGSLDMPLLNELRNTPFYHAILEAVHPAVPRALGTYQAAGTLPAGTLRIHPSVMRGMMPGAVVDPDTASRLKKLSSSAFPSTSLPRAGVHEAMHGVTHGKGLVEKIVAGGLEAGERMRVARQMLPVGVRATIGREFLRNQPEAAMDETLSYLREAAKAKDASPEIRAVAKDLFNWLGVEF